MVIEFLLLVMSNIVICLCVILILTLRNGSQSGEKIITVLVLGDLGRSPRMQFHSLSLAKRDFEVQIVCYGGTNPHKALTQRKNVQIYQMGDFPSFHKYVPRLVGYFLKVIVQFSVVLWTLCRTSKSSHLLLQNPPSIPTLAVAWLFCLFRCTRLVIDWHNYGFSILALAHSTNHPLVRFSKWFETLFGQLAYYGFCVTRAMQDDLLSNFIISRTSVLYDRPPEMFRPISDQERHKLFAKLSKSLPAFKSPDENLEETRFSRVVDKSVVLKQDRPALLLSSSSWTEDEDFGVLLNALQEYEKATSAPDSNLPDLVCVITGKGPQQSYYLEILSHKSWKHVSVSTPWLEAEDYPKLLAAADLGVCLHTSSSGLDLPMKVVDMFGCGLPVCAISFKCLDELVKHEENGYIFNNDRELSSRLKELFNGFPESKTNLNTFRENLKSFRDDDWETNWERVAFPIFS